MKIIQKKCPYCGADTQYKYGEHELKCSHCRQSCIIEYERPSFSDLLKMKEYCEQKRVSLSRRIDMESDAYQHYGMSAKELEELGKTVARMEDERDEMVRRIESCDEMLNEAIDIEIRKKEKE